MSLELLGNLAKYTPDFKELKLGPMNRQLVLIYDNMKRGRVNHHYMSGATRYGSAHTMNPHLCLKKTETGIGILLKPQKIKFNRVGGVYYRHRTTKEKLHAAEVGVIEGELYSVSLRHLTELDNANMNTVLSQREEMWVVMRDHQNEGKTVKAWVYVAKEKELNDKWPIEGLKHSNMLRKGNLNVHYL